MMKEYKVWKSTKEPKELEILIKVEKPLTEEEERKEKILSDKKI